LPTLKEIITIKIVSHAKETVYNETNKKHLDIVYSNKSMSNEKQL